MAVIYHIVGINNKLKNEFVQLISVNKNILLVDLDDITTQIRNHKLLKNLYQEFDKSKNKQKKISQISSLWKNIFQESVDKIIKNNSHKYKIIVFIGLKTYHKDHKIKIKFNAQYHFLLDINHEVMARNTIEYNIDAYYEHIIKGTFPLIYLDKNFLVKQRQQIYNIYSKLGYVKKKLHWIHEHFKKISNKSINKLFIPSKASTSNNYEKYVPLKNHHQNISNNHSNYISHKSNDKWYFASHLDYGISIKVNNHEVSDSFYNIIKSNKRLQNNKSFVDNNCNEIYAYKYNWMAVLNSIPDIKKHIIKGFINKNNKKIPFIEEKYYGAFNILDNLNVYNYELARKFNTNDYKHKITKNTNIHNKEFISSIRDYLKSHHVKFIFYT
jgi:hypothetical protein